MAPPFAKRSSRSATETESMRLSELIDLGLSRGLIDTNGNHLSFAGTTLGNGRERSRGTGRGRRRSARRFLSRKVEQSSPRRLWRAFTTHRDGGLQRVASTAIARRGGKPWMTTARL